MSWCGATGETAPIISCIWEPEQMHKQEETAETEEQARMTRQRWNKKLAAVVGPGFGRVPCVPPPGSTWTSRGSQRSSACGRSFLMGHTDSSWWPALSGSSSHSGKPLQHVCLLQSHVGVWPVLCLLQVADESLGHLHGPALEIPTRHHQTPRLTSTLGLLDGSWPVFFSQHTSTASPISLIWEVYQRISCLLVDSRFSLLLTPDAADLTDQVAEGVLQQQLEPLTQVFPKLDLGVNQEVVSKISSVLPRCSSSLQQALSWPHEETTQRSSMQQAP
ncbi:uncharacterized protein LOC119799210 isoform X2 [Cyprinodon tularosa]|uniref:uncharacterized protein LOC119799210 isoform X2 n=1 Tax=Cyprinodon tularosa TaxID=77115 RepID=UPI0018E207F5|nr:uncharacterized protein LOC119799210 isoform X2 [Cyprinodon tularosa]